MSTRQERVTAFVDGLHKVQVKQLQNAALEVQAELKERSPVDLGWFRANWDIAVNEKEKGELPSRPEADLRAKVSKTDKRPTGDIVGLMTMKKPVPVWISNRVPYAEKLARGHSKQASAGWVRRAIKRALMKVGLGHATVTEDYS